MERLKAFSYKKETLSAQFVESSIVVKGVVCDVYVHPETKKRDLGIVTIQPGFKTPLQKVMSGTETIEGLISGKGSLTVTRENESETVYEVDENTGMEFSVIVEVGETMQWQADEEKELVIFEICFPPYVDGRFKNIEEK